MNFDFCVFKVFQYPSDSVSCISADGIISKGELSFVLNNYMYFETFLVNMSSTEFVDLDQHILLP